MLELARIQTAHQKIASYVHRTPLMRSESLSSRWSTNVYLKLECLQKTGSFKPRGAFNKLFSLSDTQKAAGVVGVSGGNHAQGLAYAARELGIAAMICMPETTPANYVEATRGYGAEIQFYPTIHDAFAAAEGLVQQGKSYVHPFDDRWVAEGQGTVGLEIIEDLPSVSKCFISIGGGGLIGGIATVLKSSLNQAHSACRVYGVETHGADAMSQAIAAGEIVTIPAITSIARTLGAPAVTPLTYQLVQALVDELVVVSDQAAVRELIYFLERGKLLIEPASACCLAAADERRSEFSRDENVVIVLCGGNASLADLCHWRHQYLM